MPANIRDPLEITWYLDGAGDKVYGYIYIADITQAPVNETRELEIVWNDKVRSKPFRPMKFEAYTVFNTEPVTCEGAVCHVKLVRTPWSTLPPLMNAFELYTIIEFPQSETDQNDGMLSSKYIHIINIFTSYSSNFYTFFSHCCEKYSINLRIE